MDFPLVDEKEGRYAHVFPRQNENEALKKLATDLGDPKMVGWRGRGEDARWRLFESRIPAGVDVDQEFGRFTTPEAEKGFMEERMATLASKEAAAGAQRSVAGRAAGQSADVPEERKFYPVFGAGADKPYDRKKFDDLIAGLKGAGTNVEISYNATVGAYVHKEGPAELFDAFRTPEAKAAWEERGRVRARAQNQVTERTEEVAETAAERAKGNHFVADNMRGFLLPGPKYQAERDAMLAAMKGTSNEQLERVFKITEAEKNVLQRKQYAIELKAAEARGVSKEDFDKMDAKARRQAADGNGLSNHDFARFVSLLNGYLQLREERKDRGMFQSVDQARAAKQESGISTPAGGDGQKQELKQEAAPEQKPAGRAKSRGAAAAAALAADLGR